MPSRQSQSFTNTCVGKLIAICRRTPEVTGPPLSLCAFHRACLPWAHCPTHDNARPHVVTACRQLLEDEGIDTIKWPAWLPDLKPIEHHWDVMFLSIQRQWVALWTIQS